MHSPSRSEDLGDMQMQMHVPDLMRWLKIYIDHPESRDTPYARMQVCVCFLMSR
jgi:hypothetical protein